MGLFEIFLQTLEAGLNLWGAKEANKYRDDYRSYKQRYYEEKSKPDPDMAVLDDLEHSLFVLGSTFSAEASGPQAAPKAGPASPILPL